MPLSECHSVKVDQTVAEIFGSLDLSDCSTLWLDLSSPENRRVPDLDALLGKALWFQDRMGRLGVNVGDPTDIVNDFLARV